MNRLIAVAAKPVRVVVGLNSGTSCDGTDAAVVRFSGVGSDVALEVLASEGLPYPPELRRTLLRAPELSCAETCRLHRAVAERFAVAARRVVDAAGLRWDDVDAVGSHGQTVCHLPRAGGAAAAGDAALTPDSGACGATATLQVGDLDVLAAATGRVVVGDFRAADAAAGGFGAPLMPRLDEVLFGRQPGTLTLNLGGIAAATWLPGPAGETTAFDVGPCNVVLDLLAAAATGGVARFDDAGALAARGRVRPDLLARLLAHPYFSAPPPKTTGREAFGRSYVDGLLAAAAAEGIPVHDVLATHTALVGRAVAGAVDRFIPGGRSVVRQVVAGGGGTENPVLLRGIAEALAPAACRVLGAREGVPSAAKEAVLFALLAHDRLAGHPANIPRATGAARRVLLGKIAGG